MKQLKVIVVDDSVTIRKIIKANLNKLGITDVFEAANGDDGYKLVRSVGANIAFCDYNMPGLNGVELTEKIRKDAKVSAIKIIAISSEFDDIVKKQFRELAVNDFIEKPFDFSKFSEVIVPLLEEEKEEKSSLSREVVEKLFSGGLQSVSINGNNMIFEFGKEKITIDLDIFTASAMHFQELE